MSEIKDLLNGARKYAYNPDSLSPERAGYLRELVKVLWDNSREVKSELNQIKKDACDIVDWKKEWFDYDIRLLNLINWTQEWADALKIIDIFDAIESMWKWDNEAMSFFVVFEDGIDEALYKISKIFTTYSDSFKKLYMKLATEYFRKNKKIPDYKVILRMSFCKHMKRYMEAYVKNMKFSEEECKEGFTEIQEKLKDEGFDLEASDNIKESFIKLCREKYPLAKKNSDYLFTQKNFKKEFVESFIKKLDEEIQKQFDEVVDGCYDDIRNEEEIPESDYELMEFVNIPINIVSAMNQMVDEAIWVDWVIALYFHEIAEVFKKEHNRKLKNTTSNETKNITKKSESREEECIPERSKSSWRNSLSEEENELIKQAVSYLNAKDKEWSIIKYLMKLKFKDLPIKFHDFKTLFDIKEIPPQTESILIDQLGLEYEIEEEILKVKEEEKIIEQENKESLIQEEIIIDNPKEYLLDKMQSLWYIIDNEQTIRKQLDEFLQNENYVTVLKNLLKNPEFLKVFLHKWWHSAARVIRIWRTGWRLLFEKKRDDKFHLLCLANHNNYENRLAMVKNRRKG